MLKENYCIFLLRKPMLLMQEQKLLLFTTTNLEVRQQVERAIHEDRISFEESAGLLRRLESGLGSYTYLITPDRLDSAPSR